MQRWTVHFLGRRQWRISPSPPGHGHPAHF
jgi:hypothetical protein